MPAPPLAPRCGWRIVISPKIPQDSSFCYDSLMRNLAVLSSISSPSWLGCSVPAGSVPSLRSRFSSRSEEHTSELQSQSKIVCRLLLEKKKNNCDRFQCSEPLSLSSQINSNVAAHRVHTSCSHSL